MLNLAAIPRRTVLQVSLGSQSSFEISWDRCFNYQFHCDISANKLLSQYKFQSSVIIGVFTLTNGVHIRYLLEKRTRENKSDSGGEEVEMFAVLFELVEFSKK